MKSLNDLWNNVKRSTICTTGIPVGEKKEKGPLKKIEEMMAEMFPKSVKHKFRNLEISVSPN